ncbi:hypothetical protein RB195_025572 [Necator americanus]|uniref:Reverse transcriptase domain-containing protein n=1 Tax=Necator americanus TaxID=51031 RepID=A0ABR1ESX4_NECAM
MTKMTSLRNPKGTTVASRRGMEKITYDFYSELFDSHVHLPPHQLSEDGRMSFQRLSHPKYDILSKLLPVLINTLARVFTRYLSECKVPKQSKTSETAFLYKKENPDDIGNYRPICLLSVIYKHFTRVIFDRIEKVLDASREDITRVQDAAALTFIDLKKAFDSAETEAVMEDLDIQGIPAPYLKVLRELYSKFTTRISPFYKNIIIDVKKGPAG